MLSKPFTVVTACKAFAMPIKKDDLPPRVAWWATAFQEIKFKAEHRAGTKMGHVDELSRLLSYRGFHKITFDRRKIRSTYRRSCTDFQSIFAEF